MTQNSDNPEIIDQIHELILEDRWISAKSIAEQLSISREWVGSTIHEDKAMRKLSVKWVPECLNADQRSQRWQSSEQILEFFRRDPNDYPSGAIGDHGRNLVISLWPGDKATINGVEALGLILPQKIPSAKIRWKFLALIFWDQDGILLIDYLPKDQTINAEYYLSLLV